MNNLVIKKTIEINAPAKRVWSLFTDPELTRKMGGEYVTDWKMGDSIQWKSLDGHFYTYGIITDLEPAKLFTHQLFEIDNKSNLLSTITYEFVEAEEKTRLFAKEEIKFEMTDEQIKEADEGWDFALLTLKDTVENI